MSRRPVADAMLATMLDIAKGAANFNNTGATWEMLERQARAALYKRLDESHLPADECAAEHKDEDPLTAATAKLDICHRMIESCERREKNQAETICRLKENNAVMRNALHRIAVLPLQPAQMRAIAESVTLKGE